MSTNASTDPQPRESQFLSVIRIWAALAWADGVIVEAESAALTRLIKRSPSLSEAERRTALGFLEHRVELNVEGLTGLSADLRRGIYRTAVGLAVIDQEFPEAERRFLQRLRQALDVDEATAAEIESAFPLISASAGKQEQT